MSDEDKATENELLHRQMELLGKASEEALHSADALCRLSAAMAQVATVIRENTQSREKRFEAMEVSQAALLAAKK